MTRRRWLPASTLLLALACAPRSPSAPIDAMTDGAIEGEGPSTFTLTLLDDDLVVAPGEHITLDVRIRRSGGFSEPVLVELAGLPDPCITQAREARPGDATTTLTIVAADDATPMDRAAFVVQASTLEGLRQIAPARITIR